LTLPAGFVLLVNVTICFLYEELIYYIAQLNTVEKKKRVNGTGRKAKSRTNLFFGWQALLRRPTPI
ncbi:MAG: hypothetical protein WAM88_05920, partial [Nitrososphaeraceae archaeon]